VDEQDSAPPRRRLRVARALLVGLVALTSAGAAVTAWGGTSRDIGPLETRLSLVPSLSGGIEVGVPPLGRLDLDTHAGPLQVRATVTGIDPARARSLLRARNPGRTVTAQVTADSQDAVAAAAAKALVVALLASGVTCAVVFRRRTAVVGGTAAVAVALAASAGVAGATLRAEALTEPRFDGLLVQAPALIGRVHSFEAYSERVAQLTANVARVYGSLATLPASPSETSTRVLWVSDVHLNPQAFDVMAQLVEQFDVAAIVDTGDLTDLGSVPENRLISAVGTFGVPYLYVRGNHDSRAVTQSYVARQRGVRVLDEGEVVEVGGVRFAGIGDPTFTPNKQVKAASEANDVRLRAAGERLRGVLEADAAVDVALVHQPKMAEALFGAVPLVLDGHVHERRSRRGDGTLELTQGSSGGAGLRTLDRTEEALPLQMSVLHFDPTGALLAVDDVSVGGLGQRSVTVERRTPSSYDGSEAPPSREESD
jgi:predicted phosphodiesterase